MKCIFDIRSFFFFLRVTIILYLEQNINMSFHISMLIPQDLRRYFLAWNQSIPSESLIKYYLHLFNLKFNQIKNKILFI